MKPYPIAADWLEENGWEAEAALLRGEHVGPVDSGALAALETAGFEDAACELERRAVEHGITQFQVAANMSRAAVIELIQGAGIPLRMMTEGLFVFASATHDAASYAAELEPPDHPHHGRHHPDHEPEDR